MTGLLDEITSRWTSDVVLKRDVFSTVERGRFVTPEGEVDAVEHLDTGIRLWARVPAALGAALRDAAAGGSSDPSA